jgi:hypothetical protein
VLRRFVVSVNTISMSRLIICTKDVQQLTGKSERTALRLMDKIKKAYQKAKHQQVNVAEFCEYMGLKLDLVLSVLR